MKKTLLLLFTLTSLQLFSQVLTVGTESPEQLSNRIVNTYCITTSNWAVSSGSNFGQGNSVGFFTRQVGANFPFSRGVVLSTGHLTNLPGPNLPSNAVNGFGDGNDPAWTSDTNMNNELGVTNFTNASSLEFEFTSQKTDFKLEYVFASEEYGSRQCDLNSDVVVILLTDLVTGVTTNIAKTPTNQIISPTTIRNNFFNTSCSSQNVNLFGVGYLGSNSTTAPINMNGATVSMTAQATILTGHPYKLKIVIADRLDYQFDSAIFIKDFVPTYTPSTTIFTNNISQCEGTPLNLTANVPGNPADYDFFWQKNGVNVGVNSNSYTEINPTGTNTYRVLITPIFCDSNQGFVDEIIVQIYSPVTTPDPITLNRCAGDTTPYILTQNNAVISSGLSYTPTLTYYSNLANANSGSSSGQITSYNGPLTTMYVRISEPGSPCPAIVKQFNLGTITSPTNLGSIPVPIELCSRSTTILNQFLNINPIKDTFLNGQSSATYDVSFHQTQIGADTNTQTIIPSNAGIIIVSTGTIFVRVFVKGSTNCFTTSSFEVIVKPLQKADEQLPVIYCGTPGYTLPPLTNGKYFTNDYDGVSLTSQLPEIPAGTVITIPPGHVGTYNHPTIYVSNLVTSSNNCTQSFPLNITLIQPDSFSETNRTECDSYSLPDLDYGEFWSGPNATGTMYPAGTQITTTTTLYYNFRSDIDTLLNPACNVPAGPVTITIENKPDLGPDRPNVFTCEPPYILPSLAAYPGAKYYDNQNGTGTAIPEGTPVNATADFYVYLEDTIGTLNCPVFDYFRVMVGLEPIANINQCNYQLPVPVIGGYWDGPHLADGTCNGCTQLFPGDYIENSATIYLYVAPPTGEVCSTGQNQVSYNVSVTQPIVDDIPGFVTPSCGPFTLPPLTNGKYYTGTGGSGTELLPGYIVDTNQTIYVYNVNIGSIPLCSFEKQFVFVINPLPPVDETINSVIDLCNLTTYTLPTAIAGNYYTLPNGGGTLLNTVALREITGPFPVEVYIYNVNPSTGCKNERVIRITSAQTLADNVPSIVPIETVQSFNLPDLTVSNSRYHDNYWNPTDPDDPQNLSTTPPNIIPNPSVWSMPDPTQDFFDKTLYIYNASLDGVREICPVNKPFRIILYRQPNIFGTPNVVEMPTIYSCGNTVVTLPALTGNQKYYKESHLTGGTVFTEITGPITETTRVYIYEEVKSIIPGSTFKTFDEEYFDVFIFKVDVVANISECGSVTLPTLTSGNYYDSAGGVGSITSNVITNNTNAVITKTIYIYGTSGFPVGECQSDENIFTISITPIPVINPIPLYDANPSVIDRTYCDTDGINDGVLNIPLTQYNSTILGTQTGSEFSVTYHPNEDDALDNINPVTESLSNNPTLYAVVRNSNFANCSSTPMKIEFVINLLPEPNPEDKYLCINSVTGLPISYVTLDAGVYGNLNYEWKDMIGGSVGNNNPLYTTNILGDYTLTVTDNITGCVSDTKTVSVLPSSIAITGYTITQDFSDNQIITVIPNGLGENYIYQLDGGLFQESNVFTNVTSGNHIIIVRDKDGCGDSDPIEVLIIKYPKFFTPNSDGYNDYWNIYDLKELGDTNSKISIFDRQGKLLKQISPFGQGWDGMYNGKALLADDYWFIVNYTREGITREFKSHFSIKR
jgi:gliding motility-associated-like protein